MTRRLPADEVRRLRFQAQGLAGRPAATVAGAVREAAALQAQDTAAARLAVRPRGDDLTAADVDRAASQHRSVVRTWAMRGTLHMLPAEDVRWVLEVVGPRFVQAGRRRRLQLGLDDDVAAAALEAIREVLAGGTPRSRAELVGEVAAAGVPVGTRGQAPAHVVAYAALCGLICRGPDRDDDEPTYVLLDDWVRPGPTRPADEGLAELARRHLAAYGPATAEDVAAWSGLRIGAVRHAIRLIADELEPVTIPSGAAWLRLGDGSGAAPAGGPVRLRLLPRFDPYLLGYRDRSLVLPPAFATRVQAGGGWIHPVAVVDGEVVATWKGRATSGRFAVEVRPFTTLDSALTPLLQAEADDLGRYLDLDSSLTVHEPG